MTDAVRPDLEVVEDQEFKDLLDSSDGLAAQDAFAETRERLELLTAGRAARKRANLSQHEVAEKMKTRQSVVSALERGHVDPRLGTLQRYGHAINSPLRISFGVPDFQIAPQTFASETLTRLLTKLSHQSSARQALNVEALVQALQPAPRTWTKSLLKSLHDDGWARFEVVNDQEVYTLAEDAGALIGLSLHRDRVEGALTNLAVLGDSHISDTSVLMEDTTVETVLNTCVKVIRMLRLVSPTTPLLGVGVSVAGIVNDHTGEIQYAPALQSEAEAWRGVEFEAELQARVQSEVSADIGVAVENDANSLGLSDYLRTGAESALVVLLSGVGIGASYVVDGRVVHGAHNAVAELGHTVVRRDGPRCRAGFGHYGCVETVSSAEGMLNSMGLPSSTSADVKRGLAQLNTLVAGGDAKATEILTLAGCDVGGVIGDAVRFMDPGRLKLFAHNYLTDSKRYESAKAFQKGFRGGFAEICGQRLEMLPLLEPEWGELSRGTRARAAAKAAFWHFLQTPTQWSPNLEDAMKELQKVT